MGMLSTQSFGLARRGLDAFRGNEPPTEEFQMPIWATIMMSSTVIMFLIIDLMIVYTFSRLIPTLLMVESPQDILFEPLTSEDPDAKLDHKGDVEPDLLFVKPQPITSSFKSTIHHLRARAGKGSYLRGIHIYIVKGCVMNLLHNFLSIFLPEIFALPLATILCAPFSLAWTHIVISNPSPLPWYKRMPDIATIKKVIPATVVFALAREVTCFLPGYLTISYGLLKSDPMETTPDKLACMCIQILSVIALGGALALLVLIPALVSLTRVQASLLAENHESIVPFDRTFGGRVSEDGVLGTLDAWKTFDWSSRIRLLKTYIKTLGIEIAAAIFCAIILVVQTGMIIGLDHKKVILTTGPDGKPITIDI